MEWQTWVGWIQSCIIVGFVITSLNMLLLVSHLYCCSTGDSSHYTLDLKEARKHNVIFCLPPHTTDNQSLDTSYFGPLKPGRTITVFYPLSEAWSKGMAIIWFCCTGINPLILQFLVSFLPYQLKSLVRNQEILLLQTQSNLVRHALQKVAQSFLMKNYLNYFKGTLKLVIDESMFVGCSKIIQIQYRQLLSHFSPE